MDRRQHRCRWVQWLWGMGLPVPHIAALLELDEAIVEAFVAAPAVRAKAPPLVERDRRTIRNVTGPKVSKLYRLGYGTDQIAASLKLHPADVADWIARVVSVTGGMRTRPRTPAEQRRLESNRRRRNLRLEHAARVAESPKMFAPGSGSHRDFPKGVELPCQATKPPTSSEVLSPALPSALRERWDDGPVSPHATRVKGNGRIKEIGTFGAPPIPKPAAVSAAVKGKRWRTGPGKPKMYARGSGSRFDYPSPPPSRECLENEHSPGIGEKSRECDPPCK